MNNSVSMKILTIKETIHSILAYYLLSTYVSGNGDRRKGKSDMASTCKIFSE